MSDELNELPACTSALPAAIADEMQLRYKTIESAITLAAKLGNGVHWRELLPVEFSPPQATNIYNVNIGGGSTQTQFGSGNHMQNNGPGNTNSSYNASISGGMNNLGVVDIKGNQTQSNCPTTTANVFNTDITGPGCQNNQGQNVNARQTNVTAGQTNQAGGEINNSDGSTVHTSQQRDITGTHGSGSSVGAK